MRSSRTSLRSVALIVTLCAGGALAGGEQRPEAIPCIGADPHSGSSVLDTTQCNAWQDFHDAMVGKNWTRCADLRNDPCACAAANCTDFSGKGCGVMVTCAGDSGGSRITKISLNYFVPSRDELKAGSVQAPGTKVCSAANVCGNCGGGNECMVVLKDVYYTPSTLVPKSLAEVHAGNNLAGPIPASFGALIDLTELNLGSNKINGELPAELAKLTNLEVFNVTDNKITGSAPTLDFDDIWRTCSLGGGGNTYCNPLPDGAKRCHAHGRVKTSGACAPTPAPPTPPTPAPTMYSCNTTTAQCRRDPAGTQSAESCIDTCKCVPVHSCGQFNKTGTTSCGVHITGCNVCDACCFDWVSDQHSCDGCFNTPVATGGCGGK